MKQSANTKTQRIAPSTLKELRNLGPKRMLTWVEATAVAARQANKLRTKNDQQEQLAFDTQTLIDQPRIRIGLDPIISVAGSSHWTGTHWVISINAEDHPLRQRFTLAHEYKHIIDHGLPINPDLEERICDHFAACLLMPKRLIISAWTSGHIGRTVNAMAEAFAVSPQAMKYRLNQLGLLERNRRCGRQQLGANRMRPSNLASYGKRPGSWTGLRS